MVEENIEVKRETKKKFKYYESYITKVLKEISPDKGITMNAKQQLNSILMNLSRLISQKALELTELSSKKTISEHEVMRAVKLLFPGQLALHSITEGDRAIERYTQDNEKSGKSRQQKAGILFPPSITEKFLRGFGYYKVMVTANAPIYLAAVIEYVTSEILSLASTYINKIRITTQALEVPIMRDDIELRTLFKENNLHFLGGVVIPYIHPTLNTKKKPIKNKIKKSHRFRPGTVSLREIKKYQKIGNCLMFAKLPFEKLVREIISQLQENNTKISKDVFLILQYYLEQYLLELLEDSNSAAIHAGRVKLMPQDIDFIKSLKENKKPLNCILEEVDNFSDIELELNDDSESFES